VFHGAPEMLTLKERVRSYNNLVEDSTRVMLRIKAIFRGREVRLRVVERADDRRGQCGDIDGAAA